MLARDSYPETVPSCNLIQHGPSLRLEFKMADSEFFRTYIDSPRLKHYSESLGTKLQILSRLHCLTISRSAKKTKPNKENDQNFNISNVGYSAFGKYLIKSIENKILSP